MQRSLRCDQALAGTWGDEVTESGSYPYRFLHYLRRMYARHRLGKPAEPVSGEDISSADEKDIEKVFESGDSHLLYHSDCDGFYVPIDFRCPVEDDDVLGGAVGSTQALLRELEIVAPLIGIELENHAPTEAALALLAEYDESLPYSIERVVWYSLYENCTYSLKYGSVISFG